VLVALPFDARALKVTGDPVILGDEPASDPRSFPVVDSRPFRFGIRLGIAGLLFGFVTEHDRHVVRRERGTRGHAQSATWSLRIDHHLTRRSRGALVRSTSPSESDIWLVDLSRGGATPLSSGRGRNDNPVWSPDGTRVVWAADRDGGQSLFVKTVNDAAAEQPLFKGDAPFKNPVDWSHDGMWIVMTQLDQDTSQNVWLLDASGTKPPTVIVRGPVRDNGGPVSPDGRWIAFTSDESGRFEAYVQSFPAPGRRVQISDSGAVRSWWTRDGRQLVLLGSDLRTLSRVDLQPGDTLGIGTPKQFAKLPADLVWVDAMPDRQRFLAHCARANEHRFGHPRTELARRARAPALADIVRITEETADADATSESSPHHRGQCRGHPAGQRRTRAKQPTAGCRSSSRIRCGSRRCRTKWVTGQVGGVAVDITRQRLGLPSAIDDSRWREGCLAQPSTSRVLHSRAVGAAVRAER
jgi:hypothetical protein